MTTVFSAKRTLRILCSLLLAFGLACAWRAGRAGLAYAGDGGNAPAERTAYSQAVSEQYSFRFGTSKPFLPSNATTDTGQFIDPESFPTAKYCGHCHQAAHAQWRESAHANSFRAPWYIKNTLSLIHIS